MPRIEPAIFPLELRENSAPTRKFTFYDDYGAVVDVSGYQITLRAKRLLTIEDVGQVADSAEVLVLNASSLGTTGKFNLVFTVALTTIGPGDYFGELVQWTGGAPAAGVAPSDGIAGSVTITEAVDNTTN